MCSALHEGSSFASEYLMCNNDFWGLGSRLMVTAFLSRMQHIEAFESCGTFRGTLNARSFSTMGVQ